MSNPTLDAEMKVKRVLRYLRGQPSCVYMYPWQKLPNKISGWSDSDWAGCAVTRRSISGGGLMIGCHLISHWSRTQQCVALSSGEAELNSTLKLACEGLGLKYSLNEIQINLDLELHGDSSASQGTLHRLGSGKIKHLATRQLWLQERVYCKEVAVKKVPRSINWSDVLTHPWAAKEAHHFESMGVTSCGTIENGKVSFV